MKKTFFILLGILVLLAGCVFAYLKLAPKKIEIPKAVTNRVAFPVYTPGWLPDGYQIDKDSFSWQEGRVFIFTATDKERNRFFFTQQAKKKDFDFNMFYKTKVIDPKKLEGVPFESVYARSLFGNTWLLSIVTDKSWIMMSSETNLPQPTVQKIAQELTEYHQ